MNFIEVITILATISSKITSSQYLTCTFRYTDIRVDPPTFEEDSRDNSIIYPHECRLRDLTYSGKVVARFEFPRGEKRVLKWVCIGRIPIMLKSALCHTTNRSEEVLAQMQECPIDPGGYFVVKGQEKVILIQEQLSKNRIIIELDKKDQPSASVTR